MLPKAILVFSLLCMALTACVTGVALPASPTPRPTVLPAILTGYDIPGLWRPSACPFALPEGLVEGEDVECGYLPVYERRDGKFPSDSRIIRLAVAVFHPPGGATQPDPVIYLSGGPGASILKAIQFEFEILSEPVFAAGRSLVVFDQRGIGLSQPALDCPEFNDLNQDLLDRQLAGVSVGNQEATRLALDSLKACRDRLTLGADLTAYNSASSAADVHELRAALGYGVVNLWGGSYGTRLALEVMRRYPQDLRSVVLDAVYPPDVDLYVSAPTNFHRSLAKLFDSCATNPVCAQAYPELERVLFETVDRLNSDPVMREVTDSFTGESFDTRLSGDVLLAITFQMLYDSKLRYFIPRIIYDVSQGDFNYIDQVYGSMIGLARLSSRGMMFSVQCHEELAFSSQAAFEEGLVQYPQLVGMYANSILGGLAYRACELWSVGSAEASANQPVVSDVPTLILSGEFDPITPPTWGFHVAETLANAYAYEFPGIGHGASVADPCPMSMMIDFLQDPQRAPEASCIKEMR
jgi:pimeloyl-ACP methyl ester carboxylesterase